MSRQSSLVVLFATDPVAAFVPSWAGPVLQPLDRFGARPVPRLVSAVSAVGLLRAGVVSRAWADGQAGQYPTHLGLPARKRARALSLRPTRAGWLDLGAPVDPGGEPGEDEPVVADLLRRLRRYLAEHAPPGRVGTPAAGSVVAQVCWL